MVTGERRLILDRSFDRAIDTVLDAFLHAGFAIRTTGAGDLHRHEFASRPLRLGRVT
jgi:hypothetical protein